MNIPAPAFLVGASALFWGWQTGNLAAGAALALLLESPRVLKFRLDLKDSDYRRVADFCTVLFAAVALLLLVSRGAARGVLSSLQWFPVLLAPLFLAQCYGQGLRTSAIFLYVRRQLRRDPAYPDPLVDLSGPYVAVMVVAAGAGNLPGDGYFAGVVALASWALFALRPRSASRLVFALMLGVCVAGGYAAHVGLNRLQGLLEGWVEDWLVVLPNDAERSRTNIGSIGRIKQHDTVALRLYAAPGEKESPRLLHLASFNEYRDTTWLAREPPPGAVPLAGAATRVAPIVLKTQGGRTLLPLPAGTVEVLGIGEADVRRTWLGSVLAEAPKGWLRYEASYAGGPGYYAGPGPLDLALPKAEAAALERVAQELGLKNLPPEKAIERLERHFRDFKYSTWREEGPAAGMTGLEDFLVNARSGHCEYFAAATTLLLRAGGVPARYATGYAAVEYSNLEKAWLVRARHAHAWSRAYVGGRWIDVDLTPPLWAEAESDLAPAWEKLLDLVRWAAFRWTTRSEQEVSNGWWIVGAVLAAFLAWRLLKRRRAVRSDNAKQPERRHWHGADSEFYAVESALAARYRPRALHEPLGRFLFELAPHLDGEEKNRLQRLLDLHQRYRFDPLGLDERGRAELRAAAPKATL